MAKRGWNRIVETLEVPPKSYSKWSDYYTVMMNTYHDPDAPALKVTLQPAEYNFKMNLQCLIDAKILTDVIAGEINRLAGDLRSEGYNEGRCDEADR